MLLKRCRYLKLHLTVIDLSLSDEEEEKVVKNEDEKDGGKMLVKKEKLKNSKKMVDGFETEEISQGTTAEKQEVPAKCGAGSSVPIAVVEPPPALLEDENGAAGGVCEQRRSRKRKKKAPKTEVLRAQKRLVREVIVRLRKRAEMAPSGAVGVAVCSSLNAAIALEEHQEATTKGSLTKTFASATAEAGRVLMEVYKRHPDQTERHLKDMRLLMSVAVTSLDRELSREEVRMAWQMLKEVLMIHHIYPAKTKGLHRNCLRLRKHLLKEYEVPADVVGDLKTQLLKMLVELRGWKSYQGLHIKPFDQKMSFINELLDNRYELWDPRSEPILGRLVGTMERICTFGEGDAWNDRYASICRACSQMSRSTFVWSCDLADDITDRLERSDILQPGFEDAHRVEEDLRHVTSYDDQVRHLTDADSKKAAFDELIDRMRWIFNAVAMTRNQSLLPLNRLKRLNVCVTTLVDLCDNGSTLNLEGCLHLEKLLLVMRQVMYIRVDYASYSKRAVDALIGLFPPEKRPRFGYPAGCTRAD